MTTFALADEICTYPSAIARACAAIDESPLLRDLPDGYLRVLVRLIKKIRLASLFSPIFASRATLAKESGKSVETVARAIRWLEDQGLVSRSQKARPGFRGSESPIIPTPKLIDALTLRTTPRSTAAAECPEIIQDSTNVENIAVAPAAVQPVETYPQESPCEPPATAVKSDTSISTDLLKPQSLRKQSAPREGFVRIAGRTIPADLAWLANRMSISGLLQLMRHARERGKRLSDVVAMTRQHLTKLRDRALYAYLHTLLQQDKDYAWLRKEAEDHRVERARSSEQSAKLENAKANWQGRGFRGATGMQYWIELAFLRVIDGTGRNLGLRPMDLAFIDAVEKGKVVPISNGDQA